jgi:hypothetical protein
MRLRILYVEETGERAVHEGRDVGRILPLAVEDWEDGRRTGWPAAHAIYGFGAAIAARRWPPEEWRCTGVLPIGQTRERTMGYLRAMCGAQVDGVDAVIWLRRVALGPRREEQT